MNWQTGHYCHPQNTSVLVNPTEIVVTELCRQAVTSPLSSHCNSVFLSKMYHLWIQNESCGIFIDLTKMLHILYLECSSCVVVRLDIRCSVWFCNKLKRVFILCKRNEMFYSFSFTHLFPRRSQTQWYSSHLSCSRRPLSSPLSPSSKSQCMLSSSWLLSEPLTPPLQPAPWSE